MNDPDHNEALKPCPWCGEIPLPSSKVGETYYLIACHSDNCEVQPYVANIDNQDDIVKIWNTRVTKPTSDSISKDDVSTTQEISELRSRLSQAEAQGAELQQALQICTKCLANSSERDCDQTRSDAISKTVRIANANPLGKDILERLQAADDIIGSLMTICNDPDASQTETLLRAADFLLKIRPQTDKQAASEVDALKSQTPFKEGAD